METPFRAVNFSKHDIIERRDMDQLQQNFQWIHDNTPRGRFFKGNLTRQDTMIIVVAGRRLIRKSRRKDNAKVSVNLHKAFHPNCRPAVTTGVVSEGTAKIFCVVNGPKGVNYPNASGFEISVEMARINKKMPNGNYRKVKHVIKKPFWVHWQATGFRPENMHEF